MAKEIWQQDEIFDDKQIKELWEEIPEIWEINDLWKDEEE